MTLSEQLKEQRKQNMSQQNTMQRTSTKLSEQLKAQRQNANINPVVSTLKNASVIQTANDVKKPTLTYEQAEQIAKENNIKMPNKLTLPNLNTDAIKTEYDDNSVNSKTKEKKDNNFFKTIGQTLKNVGVGTLDSTVDRLEYIYESPFINPMPVALHEIAYNNDGKTLEEIIEQKRITPSKIAQKTEAMREKAIQDTNNLSNNLAKEIAQAGFVVGDMAPSIALGMTPLGTAGSALGIYTGAASNAQTNALANGATYEQAKANAVLSGGSELGIEMLSGGALNKLGKIPGVANLSKWTKGINNKYIRGGLNLLGDIGGEGLEEVVSGRVQPFIDRITYNPEAPMATFKEDWENFSASIIPTLMFGGVNVTMNQINKLATKQKQTIDKADISEEQKTQLKEQVEQMKNETIEQVENSQTIPQNNTNLEETSPNTVQLEQNNVQNALDFEKTVQNDEKVNSQEIKTRELQKAVQTYIEKAKNNFNTKINIAKIENISNLKQESESTIYKKARDLFSNLKKKIFVNNGENIHVTNTDISESIGKTVRNGYQKELLDVNIAVFSQLDKIIENGEKILPNVPELKNRSKYQTWDYYATPIMYNGQKYIVEFDTVIRNDGEKHFRLERVFPLYKNEEPSMDVPTKKLTTPLLEGSSVNNIIPTSQNYVNNQQENILPSTEQLKAQDLKQGEEAYNTLNMKKREETQLPSTIITKERLETERDTKISEIESKIKEKQQILQNKKRQDTKVAENLKTQIENLNKRKEDISQRYTEKIENFEYQKRKLQDEIVAEEKELEEEKVAEILDDTIAKKNNIKELAQDTVTTFKRMFVDSGADIAEIGKIANDKTLYHMYNSAKQAGQSANHMISEAQINFQGDVVGKSLIDIFEPIRKKGQDYYKEFEYYMYHLHNIDRMNLKGKALDELRMFEIENPDFATLSQEELEKLAKQEIKEQSEIQIANEYLRLINKYEKTTDKPVFGESITSEKSKGIVKQFENKYPEFKEYADDIRTWNKNLQQYRIDTGLISQEQADLMNEMYPNYVPTYRDRNGISGATKNGNTVRIVNTIKKATGSNKDILPLHEQMARQVMQTVQAGRRNILGMRLYNDVIKNADKLGKYVQEIKTTKEDTDIDAEFEFEKPELEGKFVIFDNGDRIEMQVSDGVLDGLKALTPAKWESNILSKGAKWINSKFKKLVTEWNPGFLVKNSVKDIQDAGFYSEKAKEFYKNYPQAWKEITSNGELWQKYLAMGGSDASLFDFEQGYVIPKDGIPAKAMQKISEANFLVEQAPRFAEFLRIYNQSDKSYNALMEAMYGAADITVNFGRSGTWGKFINNNLVPFFNPAVQGTSKTLRTITGDGNVKGAKNYAKHIANIVGKGVLLGVTPTMINHILLSVFGGDDYDDLNERDKDMYFLIPTGDGKYFKLPKGRVLSVIGGFARRGFDYAMGDKDVFEGFGKFVLEQTAPSNPFTNNIASPLINAGFNTTWYGSPIESESLQNVRPSQRYDEGTTEFAKGLAKVTNKINNKADWIMPDVWTSPKKIDYVLDAYGGVAADVLMPLNTKKAETSGFGKSFILDSTYSNKLSTDFYDTIEELTFDKNDDDPVAKMQLKYMNDVKEKAQNINKQIKDLQASDVENKEKLKQVRDLRKEVNTLQRDALATYKKYGETAENYLKNDAFIQFAVKGTKSDATEETKESNIEKTIKAYTDKDLFGAEYALLEYNKDVAGNQQEAEGKGIDADTFFKAYFAQKGIESDKNWKGETITNSKSKKQKEAIDKATPNLDKWERRTLYEIFNVGKSVW